MINLSGKTILVTGGCGFIGSNFLDYIFNNYKGMTVMNFDKMGVGSRTYCPPNLDSLYTLQMNDIRLLNHTHLGNLKLPDLKFDYIFHFAAESHVDRSINSPLDFISNNVIGISGLLDYMRLHQPQARFINISTDEVYGHLGLEDPPFTEMSNLAPRSPYAATKASADLVANSFYTTYGLDIVTTRCCNNYGPWQHSEKFIPTVIRCLKEGKKIPVYGNGQNIREWIFVEDHNKSILEIADIGGSGNVYNIGSSEEFTNLDIIKILIENVIGPIGVEDFKDYIEFVEDRKGHDFRYSLESLLYFRGFDLTNLDYGIGKTVAHYIK